MVLTELVKDFSCQLSNFSGLPGGNRFQVSEKNEMFLAEFENDI